jgi:hypothetical protein
MKEEKTMRAGVVAATLTFLLAIGFPVASLAGPAIDTDGDGTFDWLDNCKDVSNAAQIDTNGDGCGNRCDADFDNNGGVGVSDFGLWKSAFGQAAPGPPFNPDIDTDVNGGIGVSDFGTWKASFGGPPGPGRFGECP